MRYLGNILAWTGLKLTFLSAPPPKLLASLQFLPLFSLMLLKYVGNLRSMCTPHSLEGTALGDSRAQNVRFTFRFPAVHLNPFCESYC